MILLWNKTDSFQRHLIDMKLFRQLHADIQPRMIKTINDVSRVFDDLQQKETTSTSGLTDNDDEIIIVPLWEVNLPEGTQN